MEELSKHLPELVDYLFKGVIAIGLYHFKDIKKSMESMTSSINKLNTHMALMFEKHETKDKQIEAINHLIADLEGDVGQLRKSMHDIRDDFAPRVLVNEERLSNIVKKIEKIEDKCPVAKGM